MGTARRRRGAPSAAAAAAVAAVVAVLVALAGCSAEVSGTASAATHLGSAAQGPTSSEISAAPSSAPSPGTSGVPTADPVRPLPGLPSMSGGVSSGAAPADARPLDGASVNWLAHFCTGFADVASFAGPNTTGLSDDQVVQQVVHAYTEMSTAATRAESGLRALPTPSFPGRERIVPAALAWFHAVTTVYGQGAETIGSATYRSLEELSQAVNTVEAGMRTANAAFGDAIGSVDPSVTAAMRTLPKCSALLGSSG